MQSYFLPKLGVASRLASCGIMGLLVGAVNFYGILIWLQPFAIEGRRNFDLIPWWVAAGTHLAFGWTMALIYPLGEHASSNRISPAEMPQGQIAANSDE